MNEIKKTTNLAVAKALSISLIVVILGSIIIGIIFMAIQQNSIHDTPYCTYQYTIERDEDFINSTLFSGSGSKEDPYLLEDRIFSTGQNCCLLIKNTTKYVTIENCEFESTRKCLSLENTQNSTISIIGNIFYSESRIVSIDLDSSPGTFISNNTIYVSGTGILAVRSNFLTIENNAFIPISWQNYCLSIYSSTSCIVSSNRFYGSDGSNGILIRDSTDFLIINNNFTGSSEFSHRYGNSIEGTNLLNSIISHNRISNPNHGIRLTSSHNSFISSNIIQNCSNPGMILIRSLNCIVERNTLSFNHRGLLLWLYTNNTKVLQNTFSYQEECGLEIDDVTFNNVVYHNNFYNNNLKGSYFGFKQAFDLSQNIWYNTTLLEGNYWNDLVWCEGCVYELDGGDVIDPYPQSVPVDF
ncbi:MAG: right-handed parallel beta-helix repeat-containing protein [Candidatus Heimdallarchaeota archaeon]|nr:right-handed parallel beta-helix repeat-containing protein [Candidatus Heimdallarchaeota archaeon]